jgi:hypothetical protein
VNTVTAAVAGAARSLVRIWALSWPLLTNTVARLAPFHKTVELPTKPPPKAVRAKPAPPAAALEGEMETSAGVPGGGGVTRKLRAADVPPPGPGLKTVTAADVETARSADVSCAESWTLLTNTAARLAPFHKTVELLTKPEPKTLNVRPGVPAVALDGEIEANPGTGFGRETRKVFAVEVPPPGDGVKTVTAAVAAEARSAVRIWALN